MSHKLRALFAAAAAAAGMAVTPAIASANQTFSPGYEIRSGSDLYASPGSPVHLAMQQNDGNLVLYNGNTAMWQSRSYTHPNSHAAFQTDGNLVVYDSSNHPLWWSGTNGTSNATLAIQDDGNMVIYSGGQPVWQTHTSVPPPAPTAAWGKTLPTNPGVSGQCTWYVEDQFHQFTGVYADTTSPFNTGDAQYYGANAKAHGWTVVNTPPRVNSIVVFQAYQDGAGSVGHVAWVTGVSPDGSQINVREMDFPYPGQVTTRSGVRVLPGMQFILAP